ncbi:hypothetical protein A1351_19705 [Methylosinus sp. R-45379]|jgi:hypothetical protein|uniref:glycosyltransferase family 2 protein n=1 Tax=unclassified Methylosinus TaxID=2624500 RepID=UPI000467E362|nr:MULTISPECIES: glycosyltransferase family 2 protein [unclassified Methylosinus]OAI23428.1 hypothetical protein A1351_19705 [Methylosinus sp. R-45379]
MDDVRIFIPTRDSEKWIAGFLDAYREAGVEPLYVVDSRSADRTLSILREKGADVIEFLPSDDFAEAGMIEFGARSAGTRWVLRFDDDEFPSRSLLNWIGNKSNFAGCSAWSISCRELSCFEGELVYSQWPTRTDISDGVHFNGMARLWEAAKVSYVEKIHSCGFEAPSKLGQAPDGVFFAHFNNVLRSLPERLAKIRRYAERDRSLAWRFADECLPELTDPELHAFTSEGIEEFREFVHRLLRPGLVRDDCLSPDEHRLLAAESQRWMAEVIRAARGTIAQHREEIGALRTTVPLFESGIRIIAELTCTIGRQTGSPALQKRGAALWNISRKR